MTGFISARASAASESRLYSQFLASGSFSVESAAWTRVHALLGSASQHSVPFCPALRLHELLVTVSLFIRSNLHGVFKPTRAREWRKKEVGVSTRVAMRDDGPDGAILCRWKKGPSSTGLTLVFSTNPERRNRSFFEVQTPVASLSRYARLSRSISLWLSA